MAHIHMGGKNDTDAISYYMISFELERLGNFGLEKRVFRFLSII